MKQKLGIYIHIPFCARKCAYCDFLSAPAKRDTQIRYVEALQREIRAAADLGERYVGATVFFGGGTPSILPGGAIEEILKTLRETVHLLEDAEITVECNPGTLDRDKLRSYRRAGVNRLSIGLQSADNEELRLLGRIHTWEEFLESYLLAREAGFANINIDLISALPGQTRRGWLRTLQKAAELSPEHISAYSLIVEEGTPFFERYGEGAFGHELLPDEDTDRQMYEDTKKFLWQRGYERYEISNYAKPGFACRHNLSYWERTDYRGFGIGAASLLENTRFQNEDKLETYLEAEFSRDGLPGSRHRLSRNEQLEETMFLGLRKSRGVLLTEELEKTYGAVLKKLEADGLLIREKERVFLTDRGIDVSNCVLAEFLLEESDG